MTGILDQLRRIEKNLKPIIEDAMKKEMSMLVEGAGAVQVQQTVYDVYTPKKYKRTGDLKTSWETIPKDFGIIVRNTRLEDGNFDKNWQMGIPKYIPQVIETGEGYDYSGYGYLYEEPRPFIQNTRDMLKQDKLALSMFMNALNSRGVKTRPSKR